MQIYSHKSTPTLRRIYRIVIVLLYSFIPSPTCDSIRLAYFKFLYLKKKAKY